VETLTPWQIRYRSNEAIRIKERARCREKGAADRKQRQIYQRMYKIGLSPGIFERAWQEQEGKCAICDKVMVREGRGSDVGCADHDHASNKFRGVLCRLCNTSLGRFRDSPALLRSAVAYLRNALDKDA
jgi:hypothetical protein